MKQKILLINIYSKLIKINIFFLVFKQLSVNLDRYWRDLARFLDVTEFEIDEIDCNTNLQLNDKALKV